ncbi:MAG: alpha/beta hydrolase, partial [Arenibacter sp.]|nr:alpha/beta hydrolase [Arenibacter sp.]
MKKYILFLFFGAVFLGSAQQITLKKGVVVDSIGIKDSDSESFSLFLPSTFEMDKNWPILFVFDLEGNGKRAIRMHTEAAENQGYVLAASNNVSDTLST